MMTNVLASAAALPDEELMRRLETLAHREREATAELVAHLAALDGRPNLYAARGYGSLFGYCTQALRLSEDAACNRIKAARACRRFPVILDFLASGELSLTAVRLLARVLTTQNHERVLSRARGGNRREIERLVAEIAPQPEVPATIRKLPAPPASPLTICGGGPATPARQPAPVASHAAALLPAPRPLVQPSAPERYRIQFTIGEETHEKFRRLQALLRREVPSGDPAILFDRAVTMMLEAVERKKRARVAAARPRPSIRPGTDTSGPAPRSRHLPAEVRRWVAARDAEQCAFLAPDGRRCSERTFLEFHHRHPFGKGGAHTSGNVALYCRRHNRYEAELEFGAEGVPRRPSDHPRGTQAGAGRPAG